MAQAPANRGISVLGPEHGRNIVEACNRRGTDLDVHHPTLNPGPHAPQAYAAESNHDHFLVPHGRGRGMPFTFTQVTRKISRLPAHGEFDCCCVLAWLR